VYNGTRYLSGPVAISKQFKNLGSSVASIDAAFVWGANGKTYLFSGDHYWRYNEAFDMIDMGYPAKINDSWLGVPNNLHGLCYDLVQRKNVFFQTEWILDL
jgi:hypothetical protein